MPFVDRVAKSVLYCETYGNGVSRINRLVTC
jgi:hypothetical protein